MPDTRRVAFTFDDGPSLETTARLVHLLARQGVTATFFVNAGRLANHPELRDIVALARSFGHHIGSHGLTHRSLLSLERQDIVGEVKRAEELLMGLLTEPKVFRPPFGRIDSRVRRQLRELGYRLVLWNVDPRDWDKACCDEDCIQKVILGVAQENPSIVLFHDLVRRTPRLVEIAVDAIRAQFTAEFIPASELPDDANPGESGPLG